MKNENGRSMVEMLGVLAIIGVLSVAGIMGYTIAMRRYYANEIAEAISMMGASIKSANGGMGFEEPIHYEDLLSAPKPRYVDTLKATDDSTIVLVVDENPDLCTGVSNLIGDNHENALYVSTDDCEELSKLTVKIK